MAIEFIQTWTPSDTIGGYTVIDWRDLKDVDGDCKSFIRVEGTAVAAEAADVIKAISAFRQRSVAFVITNAVKVEQIEGLSDISASIEDIRSVNVIDMLMEHLDPAQRTAVNKLYESDEVAA